MAVPKINFSFDLSECKFELDSLQNRLLEFYLRADRRFRHAFNLNYTSDFLQFIKDKAKLKEPIHISTIGSIRGGKCLSEGSKVLLSDGSWKNIEDVEIGDRVISPQRDGKNLFCNVIGINKFVSKENYDVYQDDKNKQKLFCCSSNHLIPTYFRGTLRINKKDVNSKRKGNWYFSEKTAKQFYKKVNKDYFLVSSFPIKNFEGNSNCKLEPYCLGYYIGDGHFTSNLGVTTSDKKVVEYFKRYYKIINVKRKPDNKSATYYFSTVSSFASFLEEYGLKGKKSGGKFIPYEALKSDINYRRKLLAGLIDSDGTISKNLAYSITTKSIRLADSICYLVRSLGGTANINVIYKTIKSLGFKGKYYKIGFYLGKEIEKVPILLKRKKRDKKNYWKKSANRMSFKVKKSTPQIMYGIEIDSPSRWFITDNFIVTHNSYGMITLCVFHNACYGNEFTVDYICGNAFEFLEKIKTFPQEKLTNRIFLIDEEKQAVFGVGSLAKKTKLADIQNIIAINNISTVMINPVSWQNKEAFYGLRAFGRDFNNKVNRFMLYNLQEKGKGGELPLGNVYLPIFTAILPKKEADILEKGYLEKKQHWVNMEQRGEGDVLAELKKETAKRLVKDKKYQQLRTKKDRITYIGQILGSEWTSRELEEIENISKLIKEGYL